MRRKSPIILLLFTIFILTSLSNIRSNKPKMHLVEHTSLILNAESDVPILTPYRDLPFYLPTATSKYDRDPVILDLNHDGVMDLVARQWNPDYVVAMNTSGDIYWQHPLPSYAPLICTGDFDRDGYVDDIINYNPYQYGGYIVQAWDETGTTITGTLNNSITYPAEFINKWVGDFNSDGYLDDFIFRFSNGTSYFWGAMNFYTMQSLWNFSVGDNPIPIAQVPCDITNNGYLDNYFLNLKVGTYAINNTGEQLYSFGAGGEGVVWQGAVATDQDHDGYKDEIVYITPSGNSVDAVNENGGLRWVYSSPNAHHIDALDYDHDGWVDDVVIVEGGNLTVLNESVSKLMQTPYIGALNRLLIADVTGDGWEDFLVSGDSFIVVNHSGAILWEEPLHGFYSYPVMTGDFDGDGTTNDTLWTWGAGTLKPLRAFRWGGPRITFQFLEPLNRSVPINTLTSLDVNITSAEPTFSFSINISAGGVDQPVISTPLNPSIVAIAVRINQTGPQNLTAYLSYYGVEFCAVTVPILGVVGPIPLPFWGVFVAWVIILISINLIHPHKKLNR